jgi:hypothetical protein
METLIQIQRPLVKMCCVCKSIEFAGRIIRPKDDEYPLIVDEDSRITDGYLSHHCFVKAMGEELAKKAIARALRDGIRLEANQREYCF